MSWKMPVGIEDFRELRQGPYYFVDKTDFIRRLIDDHSKVTLFTRPRRFGKTLTMSMLEWFFSLEKADESIRLFDGLAISKEAVYMQQRGQYPVLFISLKDIRDDTWEIMRETFRSTISTWCLHHDYLCHSERVQAGLKVRLQALEMQQGNQGEMGLALYLLLMAMQQHYGRSVILLIDEYDAPIQQAWQQGFYEQAISFMRRLLGSALKSNPYLDFAVLTGVMRISKESIFSGLNNLDVYTVMSRRYDDVFGFTEEEVQTMARNLEKKEVLPVLKQWYDGYHFGSQEIYNPWSVINFFHNGEAGDYWVNTSENTILKLLLAKADGRQARNLQGLLEGKGLAVTLNEQVIYSQLRQDSSALYTLLLTTGYLTADPSMPVRRNRYLLQIPNQEIRDIYSSEILNNLTHDTDENASRESRRCHGIQSS